MTNSIARVNLILPPPRPKQTLTVVNGGAHRGAFENLRAFTAFNGESAAASLQVLYADPVPGRAHVLAERATELGVPSHAFEGRVEDAIASERPVGGAIVLNVDRASAIATALRSTEKAARPTLGYLLLKLPSGRLWAVRFVLGPQDREARALAALFFSRLADVSERNSSAEVLGASADPAHMLAEPAIRQWFAEHAKKNLGKLVAGVEPVSNAFEVTTNGQDTLPLEIIAKKQWSDPAELAREVAENPSAPIRRGSAFVLAETTKQGIRFHEVRRRTDGRTSVSGSDVIDRTSVDAQHAREAELAQRAAARRQESRDDVASFALLAGALALGLAAAMTHAERTTVSRSNPVTTTD